MRPNRCGGSICPRPFHFRHLLEKYELGEGLFEEINTSQGLRLGRILAYQAGGRDPEMHQTSGHESAYSSETGMVHSMTTTAANVHDVSEAHRLARRGVAGVGRCGVSGGLQAGGEPGAGRGLAGGDAARPTLATPPFHLPGGLFRQSSGQDRWLTAESRSSVVRPNPTGERRAAATTSPMQNQKAELPQDRPKDRMFQNRPIKHCPSKGGLVQSIPNRVAGGEVNQACRSIRKVNTAIPSSPSISGDTLGRILA